MQIMSGVLITRTRGGRGKGACVPLMFNCRVRHPLLSDALSKIDAF